MSEHRVVNKKSSKTRKKNKDEEGVEVEEPVVVVEEVKTEPNLVEAKPTEDVEKIQLLPIEEKTIPTGQRKMVKKSVTKIEGEVETNIIEEEQPFNSEEENTKMRSQMSHVIEDKINYGKKSGIIEEESKKERLSEKYEDKDSQTHIKIKDKGQEKQIIYYDEGFVEDEYDNYHKKSFRKYCWILVVIGVVTVGYRVYRRFK